MNFFKGASTVLFSSRTDREPDIELPIRTLTAAELEAVNEPTLFRLGHSTILVKLEEDYVLIDPVFSKRASPVQWAGPARFHPVPIGLESLPEITAVVISHDHYDHLDKHAIRDLANKVELFLVPLGVGNHLRQWGIDDELIVELDWWEELEWGLLKFAATPAQHFSGRTLGDRNKTLWASWVIQGAGTNLFFSGDSGYFGGFAEIGERYGPFDITMIENGAYNKAWPTVHMHPEESLQAHLDLKGKAMLPIHNSTFDLSTHAWFEPLERVHALAPEYGIDLVTPIIGDAVPILNPPETTPWWQFGAEIAE